jgi:hypothetical protein
MTAEDKAYIHGAIDAKLRGLTIEKPLTITQKKLEKQLSRADIEEAEAKGRLHRIQRKGKNATIRYPYHEAEVLVDILSQG